MLFMVTAISSVSRRWLTEMAPEEISRLSLSVGRVGPNRNSSLVRMRSRGLLGSPWKKVRFLGARSSTTFSSTLGLVMLMAWVLTNCS